ncbi:hypothetical protein [Flavobacterium lacisediminis]|uniref:Uncharacterized protein n=1 Tax=Flavobacterium lacisediminis TaxID=2989705 RepID=A0ABT3EEH8_9FLAO|nr:hypothetical protein [Flavobacterium lacisediminis]MCW1146982.1 hypothetical protein [Flavobacterium lacisediminis]
MKTMVVVIVSSLFLSNISNNKENDSIKKVMAYKIENIEKINVDNTLNSRIPIIIVKKD